jgi:Acyltransferase family
MNTLHRLHSLDNLRASMMWLGIVIHVAVIHIVGESPLIWRDQATSPAANLLVAFIHNFRMPVFFIVAGFFMAMLAQRHGSLGMLKHRFKRLALPFLLFWPPILVVTMTLALLYVHRMVRGSFGLDLTIVPPVPDKPLLNTMHLWFVYLLWWFAVGTALLSWLSRSWPAAAREALPRLLRYLGGQSWGFLVLTLPLVLAGASYRTGIVAPQGSLLPPLAEWLHNGVFFAFGWALFASRDTLLPLYARRCWVYAAAGLPFFIASLALTIAPQQGHPIPQQAIWVAFTYNAATWLWSFAVMGLFLRYLPQHNAALAYLSDSAYWVYIVHLPLTIAIGALIYGLQIGVLPKMLVNIGLTTLVCLLSYQWLVRGRWIGRLLNGTRTAKATPSSIRPMEAQA